MKKNLKNNSIVGALTALMQGWGGKVLGMLPALVLASTLHAADDEQLGLMHHHYGGKDSEIWCSDTNSTPIYLGTNYFGPRTTDEEENPCAFSSITIFPIVAEGLKFIPYHIEYVTNSFGEITENIVRSETSFSGDEPGIKDLSSSENDTYNGIIVECDCKGSCDEGCTSCGVPPNPKCKVDSINMQLSLGKTAFGKSAGTITLYATQPSTRLYNSESLKFSCDSSITRVYINNGTHLKQILAPQALVDINNTDANGYSLKFYHPAATYFSNGQYYFYASNNPYATIIVTNPVPSTTTSLKIIETINGTTKENEYTSIGGEDWSLTTGNGLRTESKTTTWDGNINTQTRTISKNGITVYKERNLYQAFANNKTNQISQIIDPDNAALTTTWIYYTDATDPTNWLWRVKEKIDPYGYWEKYQYDSRGRVTNLTAQYKNSLDTDTDSTHHKVIKTTYQTSIPQARVTTYVLGQEVRREYQVTSNDMSQVIIASTPNALHTDPNNLVTTTKMRTNGEFAGTINSVLRPDGTMTRYRYAKNSDKTFQTNTVSQGASDGYRVTSGTRTVSVLDNRGALVYECAYEDSYPSGEGIAEWNRSYTGFLLYSNWVVQSDEYGRALVMGYSDGTFATNTYSCCGLESTIDREGIRTDYGYDALKRQNLMTRSGVSTLTDHDAMGRVLTVTLQGTDGTQILQEGNTYDVAGRLLYSTNALRKVTSYSEAMMGNYRVKTTTYPDASTRIERYYSDGQLCDVSGTAVHGVAYDYGVGSGTEANLLKVGEYKLGNTNEWVETYTDMAGRQSKTVYPGGASANKYYNQKGQLKKEVDPDGVTTLYQYNTRGKVEYTAIHEGAGDSINFAGTDRITRTVTFYTNNAHGPVRMTSTYVWPTLNLDSNVLVSSLETTVDGKKSWQVQYTGLEGLTNYSETSLVAGQSKKYVNKTVPDGATTVSYYLQGRLQSVTNLDGATQLSRTSYTYDEFGRVKSVDDARTGTTTYSLDDLGRVYSTTTSGSNPQTTTQHFDDMGRITNSILPDSTIVTNVYYLTGELLRTIGSRQYPVEYEYDYAGRMKKMKTWQQYGVSAPAETTWTYDPNRGFLTSKIYPGGTNVVQYVNTPGGRLYSRTWSRNVVTTYHTNWWGGISEISYSDSTPGVTNYYDRLGRPSNIIDATGSRFRSYDLAGAVVKERYASGPLSGLYSIDRYYNSNRLTQLYIWATDRYDFLQYITYSNSPGSRLQNVSDIWNGFSATYSYVDNSSLVQEIQYYYDWYPYYWNRMTTTKSYDELNRLTRITSTPSAGSVMSFSYAYDQANQRRSVTNVDNSRWIYDYDKLGQVTSGKKYWQDGTPVAGQQFEYNFDDIGNRKSSAAGGDESGGNLRSSTYGVNHLNQYTSRTVPGAVDIIGAANSSATVTVNNTPSYRHGDYFRNEFVTNNDARAVYLSLTNLAVLNNGSNPDIVATNIGQQLLPKANESFFYDADGNLLSDGLWTNKWDAENRLVIQLTSRAITNDIPVSMWRKLEYTYDSQGRRIQKIVSTNNGTGYYPAATNHYIYNGWNLMAELDATNGLVRSYVWGTDLSGTRQGAGGVGGLLFVTDAKTINNQQSTHFVAYDGNGNVAGLVNAYTRTNSAIYEYEPFGKVLRATGPMAKANPIRFSSKYQDDETDLLYFGYRYYSASTGRWLSRDPVNELGFQATRNEDAEFISGEEMNLYAIVGNCAICYWDALGLKCGCTITLNVSPPDRKAVHKNVLNVAIDTGHTWLVLTNEDETTKTFSFGPGEQIGRRNKNIFLSGQLPGNANWPTEGDAIGATQTWDLNATDCATANKIIDDLKQSVPNYTPTYQCTSAALDVLNRIPVDPAPPSGVGHVIAKAYKITFWEGDVANPYHLAVQMGWTSGGGGSGKGKGR